MVGGLRVRFQIVDTGQTSSKKTPENTAGTRTEWLGLYLPRAYPMVAVAIGVFSPTVTYNTEPHPRLAVAYR